MTFFQLSVSNLTPQDTYAWPRGRCQKWRYRWWAGRETRWTGRSIGSSSCPHSCPPMDSGDQNDLGGERSSLWKYVKCTSGYTTTSFLDSWDYAFGNQTSFKNTPLSALLIFSVTLICASLSVNPWSKYSDHFLSPSSLLSFGGEPDESREGSNKQQP